MKWGMVLGVLVWMSACRPDSARQSPVLVTDLNDALTEAIVSDGFSPPVAARIYAYCHWASYEAVRLKDTAAYPSFSNALSQISAPPQADLQWVQTLVFTRIAKDLVYRDYLIDTIYKKVNALLKPDRETQRISAQLANRIYLAISARMKQDGYQATRNMPRFQPTGLPGHWAPTPPSYAEAVEPHFMKIKPFFITHPDSFRLPAPPVFSTDTSSDFYHEAKEVYDAVMQADAQRLYIANYWDCNPLRTQVNGHAMYAIRQLTPGGHWISIGLQACRKSGLEEVKTCQITAMNAMILFDAFLCCWNEKFHYDYIRPETFIQQHLDALWKPLLETPGFPEYPSGHSTISAASATYLESVFGPHFSFIDSAEVDFEMSPRSFHGFREAAEEAALSRLHGGIHFRSACEQGMVLGDSVASQIMRRSVTGKPLRVNE